MIKAINRNSEANGGESSNYREGHVITVKGSSTGVSELWLVSLEDSVQVGVYIIYSV